MQRGRERAGALRWWVGLSLALIVTGAAAQESTPKKYDNAAARELLIQAEQRVAKIDQAEIRIGALEDIALAKAEAGDYDGARLIARTLGTDESKAKILQKMAISQAVAGDLETAMKTIGGIKAADQKIEAVYQMSKALVKANRKDDAFAALAQMLENVLPKMKEDAAIIHCVFILGEGIARAGQPAVTSQFASAFKGDPLSEELGASLLTIAKAYNNDIPGAKTKYALIRTDGYKIAALSAIADVQTRRGDKAGLADTWKQMTQIAQAMPGIFYPMVEIATLQRDLGDLPAAQATVALALAAAQKREDTMDLAQVAETQAELGDVDGALKTLTPIKDEGYKTRAYSNIASARAQKGDMTGALASAPADASPYCQIEVMVGAVQGLLKTLKPAAKP